MAEIDPWTPGVLLLHYLPEMRARSLIGKWVRQYGRKRTLEAINQAAQSPPANAVEWITKRLANPEGDLKPWSQEWLEREVKHGRIQARPGESFSDLRKRLRA